METNLKYINLICTDLGGVGGHSLNINGENEICTLLGGTGGHSLEINALNEICTIQGVTAGHSLNLAALSAIGATAYMTNLEAWKNIQEGTTLNQMQSIKSLMAFWSDGSLVGSQLTDLSGNDRHGIVSDNIITDPSGEFGSVLTAWSVNSSVVVSNSDEQAKTGIKSFKCAVTSSTTIGGMRYQYFRTKPGETVNFSFWVYRATNTAFTIQVLKGDGTTGFQATNPTLNSWVNYTGSFVDTVGGGIGEIRGYIGVGDINFYFDDLQITITGKSNLGVQMANEAALKTIDTNYLFYTAAGIPKTVRSDSDPTLNNLKLFTGGALKYVFLADIPTVDTRKILYDKFQDHNYLFDSCEIVKTVGAGKTYATIQAAIDSCTAGSLTNKYRIDIYDNIVASVYTDYSVDIAGVYKAIFNLNKAYVYLNSIGDISISATLPETASDTEMIKAGVGEFPTLGGMKNIKIIKSNGRYALHLDASSLANCFQKYVNCEFSDLGIDNIVAYRIANELSAPATGTGGITPVGMGRQINYIADFINCKMSGVHPLTNHGGHATGLPSYLILYNCELTALPNIVPSYNPTGALMSSLRLDSTPGGPWAVKEIAQLITVTKNTDISSDASWTVTTK